MENTIVVKVGQEWRDNDLRCKHRRLIVKKVTETHAICQRGPHETRIALRRLTHKTNIGYTLVQDVLPTTEAMPTATNATPQAILNGA